MKSKELKKYPLQIVMMTLTFIINMSLPLLFGYLIDNILISGSFNLLIKWFAVTFSVTVTGMIMNFFFISYNPVKIGIQNTFKLQKQSLKCVLKMSQALYSKKDKGYYFNICENSTGAYGDLHEEMNLNMVSNLIYIAAMLAFITYVNAVFGIFFIVYGIVLVLICFNGSKPLFNMQKDVLAVQDDYMMDMRNIIENKVCINALHTEGFFSDRFNNSTVKYEKYILRYRFFEYLCHYLPDIANQICNVAFLFIAAMLVMNGKITAGILVMGYQYMGYFATPIATVCAIVVRYRSSRPHIERVDELEEEAEMSKENEAFKKETVGTEDSLIMKAENFDFYKGSEEEDFLYHIDKLELKKNGLYVIKGENGSGKSMLLNLMLGNVSPADSNGSISVAGDIDDTVMLTYPFFAINGSFTENLYGIEEDNELAKMLRVDFTDKEITGNPVNLSYGQQQKLALMRVFGCDAPILFLDEPLSNLDTDTQEKVVRYIAGLKGSKSMLVVMHSDELDEIADGVITIQGKRMSMVGR
ncbi:MAG: ABC transporter ATP-binding protein/permease [Lachnospiraceae bacterium]|nr:ABC transporter ATP-binding protein/permease [Lachnospiraceae bacterium]